VLGDTTRDGVSHQPINLSSVLAPTRSDFGVLEFNRFIGCDFLGGLSQVVPSVVGQQVTEFLAESLVCKVSDGGSHLAAIASGDTRVLSLDGWNLLFFFFIFVWVPTQSVSQSGQVDFFHIYASGGPVTKLSASLTAFNQSLSSLVGCNYHRCELFDIFFNEFSLTNLSLFCAQ